MALGKVEGRTVFSPPRFSRSVGAVSALVALAIVTIFLFPSIQGPYSVVNGPATAFRAAKSAATAHASIVQGATHRILNPIAPPVPAIAQHVSKTESHAQCTGKCDPILRC
jgi:hypothetical protein